MIKKEPSFVAASLFSAKARHGGYIHFGGQSCELKPLQVMQNTHRRIFEAYEQKVYNINKNLYSLCCIIIISFFIF